MNPLTIRSSINAMAETYDFAMRGPELGSVISPYTGERINRFLHIAMGADALVKQNEIQRKMGQITGTCFQRCVGMDALNALFSVTYEIDEKHKTGYHDRLKAFITLAHRQNMVIGGAMTDVKGERSEAPHERTIRILKTSLCK